VAIDVLGFSAAGWRSDRTIGVYNPGRRAPEQHAWLDRYAAQRSALHLYDTLQGGLMADSAGHRQLYASLLSRTDLLVSNYARFDQPKVIRDVRAISGRVFEGLAAGCRMIGVAPDAALLEAAGLETARFHHLPLEEPIEPPSSLVDDPEVIAAERAGHVALAARTGDWAHRWVTMAQTVGLELSPGMRRRLERLDELGASAEAVAESHRA
jgi:hypothetical protein